jgi:hypothetical protein
MTKEKVISKNFYGQFYNHYKINNYLLKTYIFNGFLANENLNKKEKIKYFIYIFNNELKYYFKKLLNIDNDVYIRDFIDFYNNNLNVLQIVNKFNSLFFYKKRNLIYDNDLNDSYYSLIIYLLFKIDKEKYNNKYKKYYLNYLKQIKKKIQTQCYNNNQINVIEINIDLEEVIENNDIFLNIKLEITYKISNKINIKLLKKNEIKRNANFANNNYVIDSILVIKELLMDSIINILY